MRQAPPSTAPSSRFAALVLLAGLAASGGACVLDGRTSSTPSAFVRDARQREICKSPVQDALSRHRHLVLPRSEAADDLDGDGVRDVVVVATTKGSSPRPARVLYVRDGDCVIWVGTFYAERIRALETSSGGLRDVEASAAGSAPVVFRFNGFQYDNADAMADR